MTLLIGFPWKKKHEMNLVETIDGSIIFVTDIVFRKAEEEHATQ